LNPFQENGTEWPEILKIGFFQGAIFSINNGKEQFNGGKEKNL
jgi:hypothetical protein